MALPSFFYQIDPGSMVLIIFFVVIFALLMWILRRTGIGKNNAIATVISMALSIGAIYGLVKSNFNLNDTIYSIGISEDLLYIIGPILALLFVFFLSRKKDYSTGTRRFSLKRFLTIFGGILIALGFTPLIYQKEVVIVVGAVLILLGLLIGRGKSRRTRNPSRYKEMRRNQRAEQKIVEKQNQWERKQREKEIRRRAKKIGKIRNRKANKKYEREQREEKERRQQEQQRRNAEQQRRNDQRQREEYEKRQRKEHEKQQKKAQEQQRKEQKRREERQRREYWKGYWEQQKQRRRNTGNNNQRKWWKRNRRTRQGNNQQREDERRREEERRQQEQQRRNAEQQRRNDQRRQEEHNRQQRNRDEQKLIQMWRLDKIQFERIIRSGDPRMIKREYRRLLMIYHPDKHDNSPIATNITIEIADMYRKSGVR